MTGEISVHVRYPANGRHIVLRTELDWGRDVPPTTVDPDGSFVFHVPTERAGLRYKPMLVDGTDRHWAQGPNRFALASEGVDVIYPHFFHDHCLPCDVEHAVVEHHDHDHVYRVFLPPGYHENTLERFPVVYMQDGQNLFFAADAAFGAHWRVPETLELLDRMNALEPVIVVGIYPHDRMHEYTAPGYQAYGEFLASQLKPLIDSRFRTRPEPAHTSIIGSSLGGVAAFYAGWTFPQVFGQAACLSATFGYRDDLFERVGRGSIPSTRFYLDSGWPGDNYEAVRDMRARLLARGLVSGRDLLYFSFPLAQHHEIAWADRLHLPFQFLLDPVRARGR